MTIIAIVDKTSPSGKIRIEEFRDAASEAAAVTAFVDEYSPPLAEDDYLGFDPTWAVYQVVPAGSYWAYDFDTPGVVSVVSTVNPNVKVITGTSYTVTDADNELMLVFTAGTAVAVTVNNGLSPMLFCLMVQQGAGQLTLSGTATIRSADDALKTRTQDSVASLAACGGDVLTFGGDIVL